MLDLKDPSTVIVNRVKAENHMFVLSNIKSDDAVSTCSSLLFDELLPGGVGVASPPAASTLAVSDLQVGGSTVDVVFAERRRSGHIVGVEDVGLLTSLSGESLLGETLVLHQVGVVGVFPSLGQRQRVLKHTTQVNTQSLDSY